MLTIEQHFVALRNPCDCHPKPPPFPNKNTCFGNGHMIIVLILSQLLTKESEILLQPWPTANLHYLHRIVVHTHAQH